ncbi:putative late blight resistance protein homolog r1a-6 [Phtheirospermum japonicum]|uniref:Putative late blight resistance protein homolog r1a-6 n=1 Tax=Phtheirospermum japonicum TaxID=374723 RepID=A0A830BGZ2_9LAMI|nr:putative late blight resistance protein homolog r1a-6 [Phtheirospermum japonicum]
MGKGDKNDDGLGCKKNPVSHNLNRHVVLAGGGGEGHSGIQNAILLSAFDLDSNSLSDEPVAKLGTGSDLPYRTAVHPGGEGFNLFISQKLQVSETKYYFQLQVSPDGKFLVSVGSGPARIWNVTTSTPAASLPKQNDEIFGYARFSRTSDTDQLLAIGTIQGDILILSCANMRVQSVVRKAHLGLVTALAFSLDSRALVSASLDSSARVTLIKDNKNKDGMISLWTILFVILLAIAIYYARNKDYLPLKL